MYASHFSTVDDALVRLMIHHTQLSSLLHGRRKAPVYAAVLVERILDQER